MKNRVYYLTEKRHFECRTDELPEKPSTGFIRVRYLYCSICGGDYSRFIGRRPQYPISLGHEFIARIVAIGLETPDNLDIGNLVTSDFNFRCGICSACQSGKSHFCNELESEKFSNRGFSDYADIHHSYLYPVQFNISKAYIGALIEPLSCVIHGLEKYDLRELDNSVLIYGTGGIGMLAAFYLQIVLHIKTAVYDINYCKMTRIQKIFGCEAISNRSYSLIIEATNSTQGLISCIELQITPNICSFSHLYGEQTDKIYAALTKQEATIYFPLRNGNQSNLTAAYHALSSFWDPSFDKLISFYDSTDINRAFEEKCSTDSSKQVICFEDVSNKNPNF